MKNILIFIIFMAINIYAGCTSYGNENFNSTNCYNNGTSEHWDSYRSGNYTNTTYRNSNGVRGTTDQINYDNGNYNRTYRNNQGYRSTTDKIGNTYFRDNQGNRRTITCFGNSCTCSGNACNK